MLFTPTNADIIFLRESQAGVGQLLIEARASHIVGTVDQGGEKGLDFAHVPRHIRF
jgi:hypothetical protein